MKDLSFILLFICSSVQIARAQYERQQYHSMTFAEGLFYGVAMNGGENDKGVLFEFDPSDGSYRTVYTFDGVNGSYPCGLLVQSDNGKLYGLTVSGGKTDDGTLFEFNPANKKLIKRIEFDGVNKGASPGGSLTKSINGKLYGTTDGGGANDEGVLFEFDPSTSGFMKRLDFDHATKGAFPIGNLTEANEKLYGMTSGGGASNQGTFYEFDPANGRFLTKADLGNMVKSEPIQSPSNPKLINEQPISVYVINGCSRCHATLEYLKRSNINYVAYNTTDDKDADNEMWEKLFKSNKYHGGTIAMPVVIIGKEYYFDMPDINKFIAELPGLVKKNSTTGSVQVTTTQESKPIIINKQEVTKVATGTPTNIQTGDKEPESMKGMTERHNYWREKVGVKPLVWSNALAEYAAKWAQELATRNCKMEHRPIDGKWARIYGENLYWSMGLVNVAPSVVDSWGEEIEFYNEKTGKCEGGVCGHYTQIVWKNTTALGCAVAKCGNQEIWVCNYNPPGNYVGERPY